MNKRLLIIPALMLGCGVADAMPRPSSATSLYATSEAVQTGELTVSMKSGTFTAISESKKYAAHWKSTQTSPAIDIDCGKNNIDINASNTNSYLQAWIGKDGSCDYNISVSDGWKITGFSMDVTLANAGQPVTVRTPDGTSYTIGTEATHIAVTGVNASSTLFTLVGGNYGVNLMNFVVSYASADGEKSDLRTYTVFDTRNSSVPYRIPAIGKAFNGDLVAVADYRYSKGDIGTGKLDLRLRRSTDNGKTWDELLTPDVFKGDGLDAHGKTFSSSTSLESKGRHDKCAYGDPCIVGDRTSPRMMITSCSGYPGFGQGNNTYHQGWARWYSNDNGKSWTGPVYLDEQYVYAPLREAGHSIHGFFIGSGKIHQSRYVKKGEYYRLYCAGLSQTNGSKENWVLYSDDFGESWSFLGGTKTTPLYGGDEPKVEELPNGNVILSSRTPNGRYFNIYTFSEPFDGENGTWGTKAFSSSAVNGLKANESFGTNGEIQIMPVVRKSDNQKSFLALQSLPTNGRANVKIFYKDLGDAATYANPVNFAKDWDGEYQVSTTTSAYSTWCLQSDNALGFLYEENSANSGYDIVYKHLTVETITSDAYSFDADYQYTDKKIDAELTERNKRMAELVSTVESAVDANSAYVKGEKLVTDAGQLSCPWGCKEQKPSSTTDSNWNYDLYDISTLIDNNPNTYYHTVWQNGDVTPGTHYLDVTGNKPFSGMIEVDVTRRKATDDHITEFTIYGGESTSDPSEKVAVITLDNAVSGGVCNARFAIPGGKEYGKLRFTVTATNSNRGYWHMAEFQLYPVNISDECINAKVADAYAAVEEALSVAREKQGNVTEDDIEALQTAYEAYMEAVNTVTSISSISVKQMQDGHVYDLQGRRVQKVAKGVYIMSGKKFVK